MDAQRLLNIIILVTVFVLVFSIWGLCVFLWLGQYLARLKKIQKRLGLVGPETDETKIIGLWRDIQHGENRIKLAEKLTFQERIRKIANDAGWHTQIQVVVMGTLGVAVLGFVFTVILGGGALLGLGMFILVLSVFWGYTQNRIKKRVVLFERQLLDALGFAARSLRAGHPLVGAFQVISEEIGEPLKSVFYRICQEQSLGLDLKNSLHKESRVTGNNEFKLFATAVTIQLQSGGNLADLMDTLASVLRERIRLNRKVRVLIAQTQFSAKFLAVLPVVLFFLLNAIASEYMKPFYTTTAGRFMLLTLIVMVLLGYWMMKRLAILRY